MENATYQFTIEHDRLIYTCDAFEIIEDGTTFYIVNIAAHHSAGGNHNYRLEFRYDCDAGYLRVTPADHLPDELAAIEELIADKLEAIHA